MQVVYARCCGLDIHKKRHVCTDGDGEENEPYCLRGQEPRSISLRCCEPVSQEADLGRVQKSRSVAILA
jgi:hypothetical protein